jgi:hypothetical protein
MTDEQIRNKWEEQLNKAERLNIGSFAAYYREQYRKTIPYIINNQPVNEYEIFRFDEMEGLMIDLYRKIGLQFALWYYNEFKNYTVKAEPNLDLFSQIWAADFASFGKRYAGEQIRLLKGTALSTIKRILRQLFLSEDFQRSGNFVRAKMLRSAFDKLSYMQAERIVRTEATTAANYALERGALTMYAPEQLKKRWITSLDGRERAWHAAANGQEVNSNQPFIVGGEQLMRAGQGSGRNRINCRCVTIHVPKQSSLDL